MRTRLFNLWEKLRSSYWFLPSLMAVMATFLAFAAVWVDEIWTPEWLWQSGWAYRNEPEGARALLSTVAAGTITVAGVIFSIAIVALSLASQQFGPRLLYNFMRDRGNQFVFGTFIATYLYSLLVLRTIRQGEESFVPHLAVFAGFILAVVSLGVLIFFIHHAAASIQAMTIIASVHEDLQATIARIFADPYGTSPRWQGQTSDRQMPEDFERRALPVRAPANGYLQAIDIEGLLQVARKNDLLIRTKFRPGQYVIKDAALAGVLPIGGAEREGWEKEVRAAFLLGRQRTQEQDLEFLVLELVEIAVRALSPGVNDPHTAITCIDRLGSALAALAGRDIPSSCHYDAQRRLRLVRLPHTFGGVVDASFDQIRQYGRSSAAVTIRLLETIAAVLPFTRDEEQREPLLRQAAMIERGSAAAIAEEFDRKKIRDRYLNIFKVLGKEAGLSGSTS